MTIRPWLFAWKRAIRSTPPTKPIRTSRLRLEALEDRTVPTVTATDVAGNLTVTLSGANDTTTIGAMLGGTDTVTVSNTSSINSFAGITAITVTNTSGVAGSQVVTFQDDANPSSNIAVSTLTVTGVDTVDFENPTNPLSAQNVTISGGRVVTTSEPVTVPQIQITNGLLSIAASNSGDAIGTTAHPIPVRFNTGALTTDTSAGNGNQYFDFGGGTANIGSGEIVQAGTGTVNVTNGTLLGVGANNFGDATSFNIGTGGVLDSKSSAGTETIAGLSGIGSVRGAGTLVVGNDNASSEFIGTIADDSGATLALTKTGTDLLQLSNAGNSYTGGTTVSNGYLYYSSSTALGTGAVQLGDANTPAGFFPTLLDIQGVNLANPISVNRNADLGSYDGIATASSFSGTITLNSDNLNLVGGSVDRTTYTGQITGTGTLSIANAAASAGRRTVLDNGTANPNNFAGDVTIGADTTLQLGVSSTSEQLPNSSNIHFTNAKSTLSIYNLNEAVGALISDAASAGTIQSFGGTPTLTFGANNANGDYSGTILDNGGALSLVNGGTGKQLFDGSSTIPGTTTVASGTIGGTNGSFTGPVVVQNGAALAPGTSSTTSTLSTGNVTFQAGGGYGVQVLAPTQFDALNVTGTVTLTAGAVLFVVESGTAPAAGTPITVISNDGTDAVTGTFVDTSGHAIPEGGTVTASNGTVYKVSYKGGDGNDVTLTVALPQKSLIAVGNSLGEVVVSDANTGATVLDFRPFDTANSQYTGQMSIALGDVNGDGVADLVVATRGKRAGKFKVFDGAGIIAGTVKTASNTAFVGFPLSKDNTAASNPYNQGLTIALADVNGDGHTDIIAASRTAISSVDHSILPAQVTIYAGAATYATVANAGYFQPIGSAADGLYVAAGDTNGDGTAEIAVSSANQSVVLIYGFTNGVFGQFGTAKPFGSSPFVPGNGDGQISAVYLGGSTHAQFVVGYNNPTKGVILKLLSGTGTASDAHVYGKSAFFAIDSVDRQRNHNGNVLLKFASSSPGINLIDPTTGATAGTVNSSLALTGKITLAGF